MVIDTAQSERKTCSRSHHRERVP